MLKWLKQQLYSYLFVGLPPNLDTELRRPLIVINLFSAVGLNITLALSAAAAIKQDMPLAIGL